MLKFHIGAAITYLSASANWYAYFRIGLFLLSSFLGPNISPKFSGLKKSIFSLYKSKVIISSLGLFFLYSSMKLSDTLKVLYSP